MPRTKKPDATPEAPPAAPPDLTPEALREIASANAQVDGYARALLDAQENVKQAKRIEQGCAADHLHAVELLQTCIRKWTDPVAPSLFDQKPEAAVTPDADAWRAELLEVLIDLGGMTPALLVGLADEGLHTLGDLTDWLKGPPQKQYDELPGFGPKKAEKLQDALEKFWKDRGYGATVDSESEAVDPFEADDDEDAGEAE